MSAFLTFMVFAYGLAAGFLMFRLKPANELGQGEERVLVAAGWTMTALSLTLGVGLLAFLAVRQVYPIG